ncbi:PREDICTED: retinoic acid receptor responder protein 1 [Colobus angolensis palliatus]|uniref:retinoic acid receptor responder protein 1 n=1 Tax=Colobus angolensis palliatus TaxID=336983 RepID=UPI0005F3E5F1|nr:PREDICTED: retinoic acid receptor responder protein 1 [Colobus angolensis palliatus]
MGLSGLILPCLAAHSSLLSASPPGQDLQVLRPVPSHWLRSPGLPAGVHLQPPLQPQPSGDFSHFHSGYTTRSPINARCDLPLSALVPFHLLGNHSPKAWRTQAVSLTTPGLRNCRGNAESLSWARGAARGRMGGPRSLVEGVPTVPATPSLSPRGLGQKHPAPRRGGDAASWHQAGAVRRGRESPRAAGSVEREWPHGDPSSLQIFAPGAEGRGLPRPYFRERRHRPLRARVCRSLLQEGEGHLGKCSARVFFKNQKPRPAINVTCTRLIEKKKRQQEDYLLYKQMKQLKNPLEIVSIPDNHGHIDPSLRPIWDLAFLGSSYVMWEMTTQVSHYYLAQLTSVRQWKTNDDTIDFDYTVLLHELSTQEIIPCRIHLVWYPGKPLKVKYHCQELQTPEEASGTEEGSAVPTELSNF